MGVINLSPHSFYQALPNHDEALKKAEQMVLDGVDIIDVGVGVVDIGAGIGIDVDVGVGVVGSEEERGIGAGLIDTDAAFVLNSR